MARPQKEGLDYFPHDVYASSDEKIEPLLLLYGAKGYAFYFLHLEYIYRNSDFELDISDAETKEVICQKLHISAEEYEQILKTALKKNCFDKDYFEKTGKLTSKGIKKRAAVVTEKREKMRAWYESNKRKISAAETREETTPETPQSKVKKSKVNIYNNNIYSSSSSYSEPRGKVFQFYEENIGLISSHQSEVLTSYLNDGLEPELVIEAIKDSLGSDNKWKYLNSILKKCMEQKIHTLEQYNAAKTEYENRKNKDPTAHKKTWAEKKEEEFQRNTQAVIEKLKREGVFSNE